MSRPPAGWASPRGTMAHSWVQSFATESEAFAAFARVFPENTTLLVDTYDTLEGVRHAAAIEPPVQAIRIDSGDLGHLALQLARSSISHGRSGQDHRLGGPRRIQDRPARRSGAPIDGFGVGTELVTSRDAPALAMVYKLVELEGQGKFKLSPARRPTRWPSRSSAAVTRTAGSAATMSRRCRRDGRWRAAAHSGHSIGPARAGLPSLESIRAAAGSSSPRCPSGFSPWTRSRTIRSPTASG